MDTTIESRRSIFVFFFQIKNDGAHNCLDTMGRSNGQQPALEYCHGQGGNQVFTYTKAAQIMSDENCLDLSSHDGPVKLVRCHGMGGNQAWEFTKEVNKPGKKSSSLKARTGRCYDQ